jgi:DNA-directed RNA polymerase subunit L
MKNMIQTLKNALIELMSEIKPEIESSYYTINGIFLKKVNLKIKPYKDCYTSKQICSFEDKNPICLGVSPLYYSNEYRIF